MPTKFLSILLLLGLSGSPLLAWAQTGPGGYPQRTVRVIVPAAPAA
jgi:tripartite-type tricarboxylate transporter receptor subunit TctC